MGKTQQIIERRVDELRQNMFVIHQLVIRDKKRSLSSTFMGELWEVINPLINMVVMVLVFSEMFGKGVAGAFPLYVLTGTTIYGLFNAGTSTCLNALTENKSFLIKTQLKKNMYVLEKILVALRNFFIFIVDLRVCDRAVPDTAERNVVVIYTGYPSDVGNDVRNRKNTCDH